MNCLECSEHVQRLLDGEVAPAGLDAHMAECPSCREMHALSCSLLRGLSQMPRPVPPDGFSDFVVRSVLRDRARRRRRRWLVGAAAAAAVLIAAGGIFRLSRHEPETSKAVAVQPEMTQPSLQDNVQEAGQALADLSRRTAADALQSSRSFLPTVDFNGAADPQVALADVPAESRRVWNDAVGGVTVGLEPLAASAMQAASFFRREVPLLDSEAGNAIK
ncbi:MAG TPA: hypothetical protein VGP68_06310 [Gemmataceae bacterium]|jgi:anti-sigma factor RsiW|nr:hypothetical protein [Gemmataceae bacterium]